MRRLGLNIIVTAAFLLSSCSGEAVFPEQEVSLTPSELTPLTISTGEMTRTSLSGTVVNWSDDDQIAVFDDLHTNNKFEAVEVSGSVAVFEGLVKARTTDIYAVYPYSDAVKADAQSILVCLPSDQTPVSGTFAEEHNISVAYGQKTAEADVVDGLMFRNVCALIQFTVPQRLAEVTEVSFTANNRNLAGDLVLTKADFGVACTSGVQTVKMVGDFSAGSTFYFVVAPGEISGFSAKVKTRNGATYTKSSTKAFIAKAGAIKNLGEIDFSENPYAVAKHTYDAAGALTGTSIDFSLGLPSGMEQYVTRISARMKDSNGQEYRYISKSSASTLNRMEVYAQREYVPMGQYTIQYEYVINGIVKGGYTTMIVDEQPEFVVSVSAYTSYSKYLEGNVSAANNCAPESMYDIKCSVSISDEVLKQIEMSSCTVALKQPSGSEISLSGSVNKKAGTYLSTSQYNVSEWGAYTLSSVVTFDGVTKSCPPKTLHITGLPYRAAPPTNGGTHPWAGSANQWESSYVRLHKHTISQTFYAPSNVNVSVYQNTRIYTRADDCTYKLVLSGNTLYNRDQYSFGGKATNVNESYNSVLNSSNSQLQISNSYGTIDAGLEYTNVKVYEIKVNYR